MHTGQKQGIFGGAVPTKLRVPKGGRPKNPLCGVLPRDVWANYDWFGTVGWSTSFPYPVELERLCSLCVIKEKVYWAHIVGLPASTQAW